MNNIQLQQQHAFCSLAPCLQPHNNRCGTNFVGSCGRRSIPAPALNGPTRPYSSQAKLGEDVKNVLFNEAHWLLCLGLALLLASGCSTPNEVSGVARQNVQAPVIYDSSDDANPNGGTTNSASPPVSKEKLARLSFLHNDHFGLVSIRPGRFLEMEARSTETPAISSALEQIMAPLIGSSNAQLRNIERIWILLDRDGLDLMSFEQMPVVWMIDFQESFSWDQSEIIMGDNNEPSSDAEQQPTPLSYKILNPQRLAIGSPLQINKFQETSRLQPALLSRLNLINEEADISGLLVIEPIQRPLEQTLGLFARFGEQARGIANLPEQVRSLSFEFSAFEDTSILGSLEAKDEKTADDLFLTFSGLTSMLESMAPLNGMPVNGTAGANELDSPIDLMATDVLEKISEEIKVKSLTQIDQAGKFLKIRLKRPSDLENLIAAMSTDYLATRHLEQRRERLEKIGKGMEEYEKKHGHLPPLNGDGGGEGSVREFNWRVAILPYLGEQELYDQFDFDQPWDSPQNLAVAQRIPDVFQGDGNDPIGTSLRVAAGAEQASVPATRWHASFGKTAVYRSDRKQPQLADIVDQRIRTALVLEGDVESAIAWTAPTSVELESWDVERFGEPNENGILLLDANFRARLLKKNANFLPTLISSENNPALPRNAFFR